MKEATVGLTDRGGALYEAAKTWHEYNPMLGTRGVRLGVIKPGLYAMQVRALMEAALDRVAAGGHPIVEIMIPLTVSREELALARSWVRRPPSRPRGPGRATGVGPGQDGGVGTLEVLIGTMIETPRAALRAGEIAEVADFFSFGTNDLTQMTFGFSRDDVEGRMMSAYLEQGLLKRNPFEVVDPDGVGELVRLGVERGRATRPSLKIGVCGEHGGDPESIATFARAGLDYVSCSPFRVPDRPAGCRPGRAGRLTPGPRPPKSGPRPGPSRPPRPPRRPRPSGREGPGPPARPGRGAQRAVRWLSATRYRRQPWASRTRTWPGSGRRPTSSP